MLCSSTKMYDLPVIDYVNTEDPPLRQLRTLLKSLGAETISQDTVEDTGAKTTMSFNEVSEIIDHCPCLASLTTDQELEMALNSAVLLVIAVPRGAECDAIVKNVCSKLSGDAFKGHEGILLHVLSNMFYGFCDSGQIQFWIYCTVLELAARSGLTRSVITDLSRVNSWFEQWSLPVEDKRKCLRLLHAALGKSQQTDDLARVMFELLSTYKTEADAIKAQDDARECVRTVLCDPGTFLFDHLLSLKPVESLKMDTNGDGKRLHDLLTIFVDGKYADFVAWCAREKKLADTLPLAILTYKIRVLTLNSICDNRTEVPMVEISKAVDLALGDQLDEFIIKATRTHTVRAKIDQINNRLIVGGVKNRRFSNAEWEQLCAKLDSWSSSLRQVKSYLENVTIVES